MVWALLYSFSYTTSCEDERLYFENSLQGSRGSYGLRFKKKNFLFFGAGGRGERVVDSSERHIFYLDDPSNS